MDKATGNVKEEVIKGNVKEEVIRPVSGGVMLDASLPVRAADPPRSNVADPTGYSHTVALQLKLDMGYPHMLARGIPTSMAR